MTKNDTTTEQTQAQKLGAEGGKKRAASMTKQERIAAARHAAQQRWKAAKELQQGNPHGLKADVKP